MIFLRSSSRDKLSSYWWIKSTFSFINMCAAKQNQKWINWLLFLLPEWNQTVYLEHWFLVSGVMLLHVFGKVDFSDQCLDTS